LRSQAASAPGLFAPGKPATCGQPLPKERFAQMRALFIVLDKALWFYFYLVFAAVVMSWLIAFNVVNTRNQFVGMVADFLYRISEPVLRPIRRRMPNLGGIDISPIILFFIILFLSYVIWLYIIPNVP
jgi:YggT family protein